MGSACSTDEDTRHHRENRKNRNNPTESYDTWQQKMLLDLGADPLAVVRDFPRMIVYVGTETHHNYLPVGLDNNNNNNGSSSNVHASGKANGPSRRPSENPLARSATTPPKGESEKKGAGEDGNNDISKGNGATPHGQQHHHHHNPAKHEVDQGRPPLWTEGAGGNHNHGTTPGATPGPSPPQPPRLYLGARTSQREPFRNNNDDSEDTFALRMRRVREEVLLLSELCDERSSFGAAFEAAWDRLVAQGNNNNNNNEGAVESEAASEYLPALQPSQQQQQQDEHGAHRPPALSATKRSGRPSLPLDVHQVLLNACVDSGMLALMDDACHTTPTSTTLRAMGTGGVNCTGNNNNNNNNNINSAPPAPSRTSPFGASRGSRPVSAANSGLQLPETSATTGLLGDAAPADYGAHDVAAARGAKKNGKSSSNSQSREMPSLLGPGTPGLATATAASSSRYVVRSATFHLMQFATQGVMFFPVQRLKHVLWMPWSSHMQDVSWTIHFTLKDATAADLIALKQRTLNALYNNASTVLSTEVNAAEGSNGCGVRAKKPATPAEQNADAFGAAATSTISDLDVRAAPASSGAFNAQATNISNNNHNNNNTANLSLQQSGLAEPRSTARKIIVIQHVQTGRHYVDDADRKTTPRYELDWACSIRVDRESLEHAFAPYQHFAATSPSAKASPMAAGEAGAAARLTPPSLTRRALRSDEEENDAGTPAQPRRASFEDDELGDAFESGSAAAAAEVATTTRANNGGEGIATTQQPALLQREVVASTVEVVAARVERPPHTMCMVSSTWKKRKEELDYVLDQQYHVHLEETDELHTKRLF